MSMRLPVWQNKKHAWVKWPCIPPHHLVNAMHAGSTAFFEQTFGATEGVHVPLWAAFGKTKWGQGLPAVQDPYTQPWRIGYRVHGDGFRCFKNTKMMALSWRATSARGCPWWSRHLFTLIPWCMCIKTQRGAMAKHNTLRCALRHMTRLLNVLETGLGPTVLPPGVELCDNGSQARALKDAPIAGPWLFSFAGLVGDLEFKRDAHMLIALGNYWGRKVGHVCSKCWATDENCDDASPDAPWRSQPIDNEQYLALASATDSVTPVSCATNWAHELDLDDDLHLIFQGHMSYSIPQ